MLCVEVPHPRGTWRVLRTTVVRPYWEDQVCIPLSPILIISLKDLVKKYTSFLGKRLIYRNIPTDLYEFYS